ncbi:MAG: trypsin-like peptidase domain-containing protein [Usitatibacter sp.]
MMMTPMANTKKTLYEILGVSRDANEIDIGLAHERRGFELQRAVPQDANAISLVHQAFEILSNPKRRAAYDASLVTADEKAAASQQAEPDLVIGEDDGEKPTRKLPMVPIAIGVVLVLLALFVAVRKPAEPPKPPPEPMAEAPKAPPPPKPKSAPEILADAVTSGGKVMSYEMSGNAVPVGMAVSVEPGTMVTTCHALPAGSKLVVRVGAESLPADLTITDETLDLCRLAVAGFTTRPFSLATEESKAGDKIYAVGVNKAGEFALTEGTIKQVRAVPSGKVLEVSMPIAPAGSGGPIFNEYGKVVGIATTPHPYGAGLNIAVPISWVSEMRSRGRTQ